ncbi:MAG: hypothetical protein ACM3X9_05365 [Bacillota bacterium]
MADDAPEKESFINRKRPALEGLIEDILGPASVLDQTLGGKPVFPVEENEFEPEADLVEEEKK